MKKFFQIVDNKIRLILAEILGWRSLHVLLTMHCSIYLHPKWLELVRQWEGWINSSVQKFGVGLFKKKTKNYSNIVKYYYYNNYIN